jgi:asparagine synthase (glutamine-hydrolysing)
MSVIFGIRALDGRPIESQEFERLARCSERYAPDGTSFRVDGEIGMGFQAYHTHQRSHLESQPLVDGHGNTLAFDGRLDNYRDLCGLLGVPACESSDSLIVLKAFDRWGDDCFSQFVGDWSLALWSPASHTLYLARDHAGTRTLYFEQTKDHILWSTYLETFFVTEKTRGLDSDFAASYLGSLPIGELTPYKGIRAVPSAHFLRFEQHRKLEVPHWTPLFRDKLLYRTDVECERHFFSLFRQAVARRSAPDDPVIAQLSGGMDSTSVVAMSDFIRAGAGTEGLIDTVSYYDDSEPNWNERPYFTAVEKHRGKVGTHIPTLFSARTVDRPDRGYLLPGADANTAAIEERLESSIGPGRYRAVISGVGGDELLGGPINPLPELADYLARGEIAGLFRRATAWCIAERVPIVHLLPEVIRFAAKLYFPFRNNTVNCPSWYTSRLHDVLHHLENRGGASVRSLPSFLDGRRMWMSILETQPHCFPSLRVRYEYRYPLLDRDLADFLLRVPPVQIRRPGNRRSLMRRAMRGIVPIEVLERKRKAFPARALSLFLLDHRHQINALFRESRLGAMGYIDETKFRRELYRSDFDQTKPLTKMIGLELWLRNGLVSSIDTVSEPQRIRVKRAVREVRLMRKFKAT